MKLMLISVGRTSYAPLKEATERYAKRIGHYLPFELKELPDIKNSKSLSEEQQKTQEGAMILGALQASDFVALLDERGKEYTSREFAQFLSGKMSTLGGRLVMVIGGPYGFSQQVYDRANFKLSLSKMTFPHEMAKLFITEQAYRAMTILRGEPYHHD